MRCLCPSLQYSDIATDFGIFRRIIEHTHSSTILKPLLHLLEHNHYLSVFPNHYLLGQFPAGFFVPIPGLLRIDF